MLVLALRVEYLTLVEEDSSHDQKRACPAHNSSEVGGNREQGSNEDRSSNKEVGVPFVASLKIIFRKGKCFIS